MLGHRKGKKEEARQSQGGRGPFQLRRVEGGWNEGKHQGGGQPFRADSVESPRKFSGHRENAGKPVQAQHSPSPALPHTGSGSSDLQPHFSQGDSEAQAEDQE